MLFASQCIAGERRADIVTTSTPAKRTLPVVQFGSAPKCF